jgi:hypothetical protein
MEENDLTTLLWFVDATDEDAPAGAVVVVVVALVIVTVVENAFVLLPNWNVIVPELVAATVQDKDVEEPELMSMFAEV